MVGYLFGGDGMPKSQSELRRLRQAAEAMAPRRAPSNVGEGLSFLGQAIATRMLANKADNAEQQVGALNAGMQKSALESYLGEQGVGDPYASALQPPTSAAQPAAPTAPASGQFAELAPRIAGDLSRDLGLAPHQAAAIVGNLGTETGGFKHMQELNPVVPGSRGGFGWAQWTGPRRKQFEQWSAQNGLDPTSYEANYGFLKHELTNTPESRVLDGLRKAQDVGTATSIFEQQFLRPGIPHSGSRQRYAQQALALLGNGEPQAAGGATFNEPMLVYDDKGMRMEAPQRNPQLPPPDFLTQNRDMIYDDKGARPAPVGAYSVAPNRQVSPQQAQEIIAASQPRAYSPPQGVDPASLVQPMSLAPQPQMPPEMAAVNAMAGAQPSPAPAPMPPQMPPQQPMQAPPRPISTAGMNYDPATGRVGPGASLNEGATAMPAAAAAFGGAPMAGMRPQAPAPMRGAPAGQPMQPPGISPLPPGRQGDQSTRAMIIDMLTNPAASDETRNLGQMLLQRELAKNAPVQPDFQFITAPDGTIIRADKNSGRIDPLGQFAKPEEPKEGYTPLTREERAALGIPESDTRVYQRGPGGQISAVGGAGQTINVGNEIEQRRAAAAAVGLKEDDPRYQSFILTGNMPRESEQPLTATDKKAILEADEMVMQAQGVLPLLERAMTLSEKAYEGPTAGTRGTVTGIFGDEGGLATTELNQVVAEQALGQLKAIFGGAPTEGERKILLDISGSASLPRPVRDEIYKRAKAAVERRLKFYQERADGIRGGDFYTTQTPAGAESAPPAAGAVTPPNSALDKARAAIAAGADPEAVKQRLKDAGIDPAGL